jgi:outer membrane protein W
VNRSDFNSFTGGLDFNFRIAPRFDVVVGGSYAGSKTPSEFRDFVDQNNLPIQQTTKFQRVPLTVSLKAYLVPPGRSFGRFAWVPSRVAPWVGVGGGAEWYKFEQTGDFVDFQTSDIFSDVYTSSGWSPEAHAMAGVDVSLSPRFFLTGEGRYSWAKTSMSNDFAGFNKIDLSGLSATVGIGVRF